MHLPYFQLCYTRGSIIPLCLYIRSSDSQALDLLSNSRNINIQLRRRVHFQEAPRVGTANFNPVLKKDTEEVSSTAAWWPANDRERLDGNTTRKWYGEIHLEKNLKPSMTISHFKLQVRDSHSFPCCGRCTARGWSC
jgi:hypothetical protein